MPQEVRVLQCFSCKIFQVDIVKKTSKWQCRVCNIKQTVRKECFRGTAKECRTKVQQLNMTKGQKYNESVNSILEVLEAATDGSLLKNEDVLDGTYNNAAIDQDQKLSTNDISHKTSGETKKYCRGIIKAEKQKRDQAVNSNMEVLEAENDNDVNLCHTSNCFANNEKHSLSKEDFSSTSSNENNVMFDFSQSKKWTSRSETVQNAKKSKWDNYV
ncbi:uncharacterized protein LOC119599640 [Lucilia sericata]|uniref:uncharacterized protein LOC119599640 n=1 Tax=Lucilia sericata TaxID=13632 RepID=UPI0018A881D1|nr:uncharacterized protein LOC119599640 [Lucilia sericata]